MEKKRRKTFHLTDEKFSLRDFKGVLILLTALLAVQLLIYFVRVVPAKADKGLSISLVKTESADSVRKKESAACLKEFDPNTVDSTTLVSFGFSPKQVSSILKYRSAGGRFYRSEDFSKLYVVNEYMYKRLSPYIRIKGQHQDKPVQGPVDINKADSAGLDRLPGIGGFYARKIIEYRNRLGWFVDSRQLLEIYRFGDERFEKLKDKVAVGQRDRVFLSDCDSVFIVQHPYLGRSAYKAIVEYNAFSGDRRIGIREYLENKVIVSLNGEYLMKQFR